MASERGNRIPGTRAGNKAKVGNRKRFFGLDFSYFCNINNGNASATDLRRCYFFLFNHQHTFKIKEVVMSGILYVTKETLEQMKAELIQLKTVERPAASRAIAEAREKGDLKENAEYDAAKEAQGILEAKMKKLEGDLAMARVLDESNVDTSKVSILTKVTVTNLSTQKQLTYQIVSEKEADLKLAKISITSPIGKGLMGKIIGDIAEVQVPAGLIKFRIDNISA
jgi:transcription elongation factor GreA